MLQAPKQRGTDVGVLDVEDGLTTFSAEHRPTLGRPPRPRREISQRGAVRWPSPDRLPPASDPTRTRAVFRASQSDSPHAAAQLPVSGSTSECFQPFQHVQVVSAATVSAASRVQPPMKTARRRKRAWFVRREQVIAPGNRIPHRALSWRQVPATASQQEQSLLETVQELIEWQNVDPSRGQLDGEGQAVETATNRGNSWSVVRREHKVPGASRLRARRRVRPRGPELSRPAPSFGRSAGAARGATERRVHPGREGPPG